MSTAAENGVLINVAGLKGSLSSCGTIPFAINLSNLLNDLEGVHESPNTEVTKGFQAITRFLQASKTDKFIAYRLMKRAYDALNDLIENHIGIDDDIERDLLLMSWNQLVMDRMESLIKASEDYLFCVDLDEAEEFDEKYGVRTRTVYDEDGDDCFFGAMSPALPGLFPRITIPVGSVVLPESNKVVQLHRLPMVSERIGVSVCPFFTPEKEKEANEVSIPDGKKDSLAYLNSHMVHMSVGADVFILGKHSVTRITNGAAIPTCDTVTVEEKYNCLCETFNLPVLEASYDNIIRNMIDLVGCRADSFLTLIVDDIKMTLKGGNILVTSVPFANKLIEEVSTVKTDNVMFEAAKLLGEYMKSTNGLNKELSEKGDK